MTRWKDGQTRIVGGHLDLVPTEIIEHAFYQLDVKSLLACRRINRHLKGVVDGSVLLQYKIELGVAGMVDGPPSHVTIGERWNRVRTHTDSWSGLSFETVQEIPCQKASRLQLYGNILARCVGKSTLAFNLLPGHARGISAKEWRFENFSFSIEDYVIDPVQDLLIVLPAQDAAPPRLYLSSLSTGEPHPLALESELSYPSGLIYDHFKLYLSGGFLGAQFRPAGGEPTEHLIVWSWKDGSICLWICNIRAGADFALMGDYLLLAPQPHTRAHPRIETYELDTTVNRAEPLSWTGSEYCCAFEYPFHEHRTLSWLIQHSASSSADPGGGLFHSASDDCVVVEMSYDKIRLSTGDEGVDDGHGDHSLELMHTIPDAVLHSRIDQSCSHPGSQKLWLWEDWGVGRTFMTGPFRPYGRASSSRRQLASAYRSIEWLAPLENNGLARPVVALHDFRPWRFRRSMRDGEAEVHAVKTCNEEFWINHTRFLECARVNLQLPPLVTGYQWSFAISEDNIVAFREDFQEVVCFVMSV